MDRNLQNLLRWSVQNSENPEEAQQAIAQQASTAVGPTNGSGSGLGQPASSSAGAASSSSSNSGNRLDPGVLEAILGKSDAQRMMETVTELKSQGKWTLEQKLILWDDLELLVESIDNANDLENMKLWRPITDFLDDEQEEMRLQACWVLGTAIQNNPRSQKAFLDLDPLPRLLELLQHDNSAELRSKCLYAISGLLRHFQPAVDRFTQLHGWKVLANSLNDPAIVLRRKSAFLIHSLFMNTTTSEEAAQYQAAAREGGVHSTLLDSLRSSTALPTGPNGETEAIDADYNDKALAALVCIVDKAGQGSAKKVFSQEEQSTLRQLLKEVEAEDRKPGDVDEKAWLDFTTSVQATA